MQFAISARYGPLIALLLSQSQRQRTDLFRNIRSRPLATLAEVWSIERINERGGASPLRQCNVPTAYDRLPYPLNGLSTMNDDRLELDEVFPAPPSRDEELCRIANLPLEPSFDDTGLELLELDLDPDSDAC